jgi:hypothetical protein
MVKKWYCLNCKKFVDIYLDYFKGFARTCKGCGSSRLMELNNVKKKDFKKLIKDFQEKTGKI